MFVSAHDIASQKQHKSVSASDVLKALEQLDMGDMVPKLQQDLQCMILYYWFWRYQVSRLSAYRANQKPTTKKGSAKDKADSASTSKGKQKADPSAADSAVNSKGKEKATITIPSRASVPAQNQPKTLTILEPEAQPDEDVDEEDEVIDGEDEMLEPEEHEDVEDVEDEPEEEDLEDEGEEAADDAALEEEELPRDAKVVEERSNDMDEDD